MCLFLYKKHVSVGNAVYKVFDSSPASGDRVSDNSLPKFDSESYLGSLTTLQYTEERLNDCVLVIISGFSAKANIFDRTTFGDNSVWVELLEHTDIDRSCARPIHFSRVPDFRVSSEVSGPIIGCYWLAEVDGWHNVLTGEHNELFGGEHTDLPAG